MGAESSGTRRRRVTRQVRRKRGAGGAEVKGCEHSHRRLPLPIRVVLSHSATVWDTRCQGGSVADLACSGVCSVRRTA